MDSTTIRRGVDAAMCLTALGALWTLTRFLPGVGAVAPAAVTIGVAIVILSLADREGSPLLLGVPALMVVLVATTSERERLLAFGVVLASCLLGAGWRWVEDGRVSSPRAVAMLVAALGSAAALPFGGSGIAAALLSGFGAVAIVAVAAKDRRVGIDVVMLAYCAALAAPAVPLRAALFPFVVAALVVVLRRPAPFSVGAFALLVLAAGKWYLPLLLAAATGFAVARQRAKGAADGGDSAALVVPFLTGFPAATVATLAVAPDAWERARRAGLAASVTSAALALGSLFVQPSLATLYALTALVCLVGVEAGKRWSPTLVAFVLVMSGLTAWSGAMAGAFPFPVGLAVIVFLAAGVLCGDGAGLTGEGRFLHARSAIGAGLAAAVVLLHPTQQPSGEPIASNLRVASGETVTVPLPADVETVRLAVSGGDVAALDVGVVVGVVRADPGGETREVKIGEIADWGARREEHFLSTNNPQPLMPAGPVLGSGREAFLSGAGVIRVSVAGARSIAIEALPALGEKGTLIVDSVEVERR